MFSVDVERAHAPLGSVSSRWEGIRRPVRRHAVERRPAELLRGSGLMRTDLGSVQPPFRRTPEGTHRQKRRLWRGRAQRGSTCGSRPLTPAVPERLEGRLWPVAKKRNEYGTRAQEGKDTAPRRRMFIGHEPAKGSRAAWRESKQEAANPSLTAPRPAQSRRCRHLLRFPRLLYYLLLPRIQSWAPMSAPPSSSAGSRSLKLPWAGSARTWVAFGR